MKLQLSALIGMPLAFTFRQIDSPHREALLGFQRSEWEINWRTIMFSNVKRRAGKFTWGLAALLVGLPLPFVILAFLAPGCR